ncbi:MAG: hypothetical protein NTV58_10920 [Deltaproteobacteria bacterium]|nr:hypothetical protein [Deltaproteobacteria bacterium]
MNRKCLLVDLVAILVIAFTVTGFAADKKSSVAVLDFESMGTEDYLGKAVSEIMRTALVSNQNYRVVERAQINKALSEQKFQKSGIIDDKSAVEIGKVLGADLIIVGSVVKIGNAYTINSRMIEVKTGEAKLGRNVTGTDLNLLTSMSNELVEDLFGTSPKPISPGKEMIKSAKYKPQSVKWIFNEQYWLPENGNLHYVGYGRDEVAWLDWALPANFSIAFDFTAKSTSDNRYQSADFYEMIFIVHGSKSLDSSFWQEGIKINYLVGAPGSETGNESWIRTGSIYDPKWISNRNKLNLFSPDRPHKIKIIYMDKRLSFYIDGKLIHDGIYVILNNNIGYFGVANYHGNKNEFLISNLTIN